MNNIIGANVLRYTNPAGSAPEYAYFNIKSSRLVYPCSCQIFKMINRNQMQIYCVLHISNVRVVM